LNANSQTDVRIKNPHLPLETGSITKQKRHRMCDGKNVTSQIGAKQLRDVLLSALIADEEKKSTP